MNVELEIGDIILQDVSYFKNEIGFWERQLYKLQRKLDDGPATHAMVYIGNGSILEMSYNGLNNRTELYDNKGYMDKGFCILRHKIPIKPYQFRRIVADWLNSHKNTKYSYKGWFNAALSLITYKLIGRRIKLFKEERSAFCSEFIGELYENTHTHCLSVHNDIITPNDIYYEKNLRVIKGFHTV